MERRTGTIVPACLLFDRYGHSSGVRMPACGPAPLAGVPGPPIAAGLDPRSRTGSDTLPITATV